MVFSKISTTLIKPKNIKILSNTALSTPLGDLASFLEYAELKLPKINNAIKRLLSKPVAIKELARFACSSSLSGLLKFLSTAALAQEIVDAIDRDAWDKARLSMASEQPNYFPSLVSQLNRLKHLELAEAPAHALLLAAEAPHWHAKVIGLHHLTQTLRLGRTAGIETILRFLDIIVTRSWLDTQYALASSGTIAASLYSLWGYHGEQVLNYFLTDSLISRVKSEAKKINRLNLAELSAVLQLIGVCILAGIDPNAISVPYPDNKRINEVIEFTVQQRDLDEIGHIQIQLWVSLYEMARLLSENIRVRPDIGKQILTLWKNAEGITKRHKVLNKSMVEWLERCAKSGWVLKPDDTSLKDIAAAIVK